MYNPWRRQPAHHQRAPWEEQQRHNIEHALTHAFAGVRKTTTLHRNRPLLSMREARMLAGVAMTCIPRQEPQVEKF